MKISLISVEDNLTNIGIRRISSWLRSSGHNIKLIFLPTLSYSTIWNKLNPPQLANFNNDIISQLAELVKDSDLIAFSSMTNYATMTKSLITGIRRILPDKKIIWGGVHPTVFPEDAIQYADIVCVGEGEGAFKDILSAISSKKEPYSIKNLWFKVNGRIIKNTCRPLLTNNELDNLPYMDYGVEDSFILDRNKIISITQKHYINYCGVYYFTMYTLGCPFSCSYCSHDVLANLDKGYNRIRKPSVNHFRGEILDVKKRFPHIRFILIYDDAFCAMKLEDIQEFAAMYKKQIDLPFSFQWHPVNVTEEKLKVLIDAGLDRVRMGIQSGSPRILNLYNRNTSLNSIVNASKLFSRYKNVLIPPVYHIIVDNPYETKEDRLQTIKMLDNLYPPFTINIFSLQFFPGTQLTKKALKDGICDINKQAHKQFKIYQPTYSNLIISLYGIGKIPRKLLRFLLSNKRMDSNKTYPFLIKVVYWITLLRKGINNFRKKIKNAINAYSKKGRKYLQYKT